MKKRIIGLFLSLAILIPLKIVLSAGICTPSSPPPPCYSDWVSTQIYLKADINPLVPSDCYSGSHIYADDLTDYLQLNQGFQVAITVHSGGCEIENFYDYGSPNYSPGSGLFTISVPSSSAYHVVVELRGPCECGYASEGSNQRMVWKSRVGDELLEFDANYMPGSNLRPKDPLHATSSTIDNGCGGTAPKPNE